METKIVLALVVLFSAFLSKNGTSISLNCTAGEIKKHKCPPLERLIGGEPIVTPKDNPICIDQYIDGLHVWFISPDVKECDCKFATAIGAKQECKDEFPGSFPPNSQKCPLFASKSIPIERIPIERLKDSYGDETTCKTRVRENCLLACVEEDSPETFPSSIACCVPNKPLLPN